jgi:hypothetical protein
MVEDEEQEALKVEPRSPIFSKEIQQLSGEQEETRAPSTYVRRPQWFSRTLRDAQEHVETPRSTFRESKPPKKFPDYMRLMSSILESEPSIFQKAANQQVWRDAMVEYISIIKNDVWNIVRRSKGKSIVSSKWLYKIKHATNGSIEKFKARFVVREFSQREGVDYGETFVPSTRYTEQPQSFEVSGKESHVCFAMSTLIRFMVEARQEHWVVAKHVLRYLKGNGE